MTRGGLAGVAVVAFFLCPMTDAAESNRLNVSKMSMQSGGQRIRIDKYATRPLAHRPAILVLHGAGGILWDGPEMRRVARQLAESGHTVYLLHYFNRTGTIFGFDAGMHKDFETWLETVRDAIRLVREDQADGLPMGMFGYSLGAFLAVAAASDNPHVGAVVELAGGIWNGKAQRIGKMPPVLIVHGEEDRRVPFQKYARQLLSVLNQRGAIVKSRFFPAESHRFKAQAMSEVRAAAVAFFQEHLAKSSTF